MKPYYSHAGIEIYLGDCRYILPQLDADTLITDPPYGVNLGNHEGAKDDRFKHLNKTGYATYKDTQKTSPK